MKMCSLKVGVLLVCLFATIPHVFADDEQTCEDDNTCKAASSRQSASSGITMTTADFCSEAGDNGSSNLYSHGASAQAYRPKAPISSTVCQPSEADRQYRAASWPFSRGIWPSGTAPQLTVTMQLWSCTTGDSIDSCRCRPIDSALNSGSEIEVWQTYPDGTYSSLQSSSSQQPGDCRARVPVIGRGGAIFTTVAPGSTGMFHGLGPNGWESSPYGPPVVHFLSRIKGHVPVLLELPIMINLKTLEQRKNFLFGDYRGVTWNRGNGTPPMKIASWEPNVEENQINIAVDVYLQPSTSETKGDVPVEFCPSSFYGLPSSFFLEPMAVCAPSLLNFLDL